MFKFCRLYMYMLAIAGLFNIAMVFTCEYSCIGEYSDAASFGNSLAFGHAFFFGGVWHDASELDTLAFVPGVSELANAAYALDFKKVRSIFRQEVDIDIRDSIGRTPLIYVSALPTFYDRTKMASKLAMIRFLIENRAQIDLQDNEGDTCLHNACWERGAEIVTFLLQKGACRIINLRNKYGETPLHKTTFNKENREILLQYGADATIVDNQGRTPLQCLRKIMLGSDNEGCELLEKAELAQRAKQSTSSY